jgi:hypothetical protein
MNTLIKEEKEMSTELRPHKGTGQRNKHSHS